MGTSKLKIDIDELQEKIDQESKNSQKKIIK